MEKNRKDKGGEEEDKVNFDVNDVKMNKLETLNSSLKKKNVSDGELTSIEKPSHDIPMLGKQKHDEQLTSKGNTNQKKIVKKRKLEVWTKKEVLGENFVMKQGVLPEEDIKTQERPWSFQNNLKWKMILEKAEEDENSFERATKERSDIGEDMIDNFKNFRMAEDPSKVAEPPPKKSKESYKPKILGNKFLPPNLHPDYVNIGPLYGNKELYEMMKEAAGDLFENHRGVKSMSGEISVE